MGWNTTEQNDILYLANGLDISGLTIKKAEKIIKTLNMLILKKNLQRKYLTLIKKSVIKFTQKSSKQ